jgi:hypothetical protein
MPKSIAAQITENKEPDKNGFLAARNDRVFFTLPWREAAMYPAGS